MPDNMSLRILIEKFLNLFMPPIVIKGARTIQNKLKKEDRGSLGYRYMEYAPEGWKTQLANDQNKGWSVDSVVEAERVKWEALILI